MNNNFAYIAGYVDGNGGFFIGKHIDKRTSRFKYRAEYAVASTNKEVLLFISGIFGGTLILLGENHNKFPCKQAHYQLTLRQKKALVFVEKLLPFLKDKKECALILKKFIQAKTISIRNQLIEEMHQENNVKNLVTSEEVKRLSKIKSTYDPIQTDYAYLAGFIDSKGSFTIGYSTPKGKSNIIFRAYLSLDNNKMLSIQWMRKSFGGSICCKNRSKIINRNYRDSISWSISCVPLRAILSKIYPLLKYKKQHCKEMINFYKLVPSPGGNRRGEYFKQLSKQTIEAKMEIKQRLHQLNQSTY